MTLSVATNNMALGKKVTIQHGGTLCGYIAQHITDGNSSTMWRSYAADMPATLTAETTLDLGETMLFNQIVLTEYKQYAVRLIVSISDDGNVWSPVYDRVPAFTECSNRKTMIEVDHLAARYIRVTAPDAIYGFGICGLEVYQQTGFSSMIVCTDLHGGEAREVGYPRDQFHLYLLIGQSNMASRAPLEDLDIPAPDRVYLFNGLNQWEDAAAGHVANYPDKTVLQGLNRYSSVEVKNKANGLSLGTVAAREVTDALPHIAVGLISNARGGTSLAQWQKGCGTWLYEEAVRRTKEAMKSGTLKGILWHQGESDVGHAGSYLSDLNAMVVNLRADLGMPDVPFIAGQIMPGKSDTFNAMLESIGQTIAHADWVSSCGTASIGDGSHFDAASQRLLGRRYASKLWPMVYPDMAVTELPEE